MADGELGRTLRTRGGLESASVQRIATPRSTAEASDLLRDAAASAVTLVGAQRSFEGHFLPPHSAAGALCLSSERLRGGARVVESSASGTLRVRALAGTSFGELLAFVHAEAGDFMPFSCPTAEAISLGGALAVNTHGRTSDTYGGFFADRVRWFRLVGAAGRVYECHAESSSELERELFRYVPGALGALGLVTELELELAAIGPRAIVCAHVLEQRTADLLATVGTYARLADDNRVGADFRWPEGVSAVFFGPPSSGRSVVMARTRESKANSSSKTLPLFGGSRAGAAALQAVLHRFTAPASSLAARVLAPGRSFSSEYQRWAFFQSSYDAAAERLARLAPWQRFLPVDPYLTLVHQGWVVPRHAILDFMALYQRELERDEYRALHPKLEFQDVLAVPRSVSPLNPSHRHERGSHIFTLSIALPHARPELLATARKFCSALSRKGHALGVLVQLVKQLHADDALLREMYRQPLSELCALKRRVDPHAVFRTRTLERLGVC